MIANLIRESLNGTILVKAVSPDGSFADVSHDNVVCHMSMLFVTWLCCASQNCSAYHTKTVNIVNETAGDNWHIYSQILQQLLK